MSTDDSRLDVPGFSFGVKTGEFIDVPKIFGGRPTPKRSGTPHTLNEQISAHTFSRTRKAVQRAAKVSKEDYFRRKRIRNRELKKAITNNTAIEPCIRRVLEHLGLKAHSTSYVEKPELFISKAKTAYEITDGFCPMVTTTSAREALFICASLAQYGIAAYFNKIAVPY